MPLVDTQKRKIYVNVVYMGPSFAGKSTNISFLAEKFSSTHNLLYLQNKSQRTLFFDCVSLTLPNFQGFACHAQVYSLSGQAYWATLSERLLASADAIVFVADSQATRMEANLNSLLRLQELGLHHPAIEKKIFLQYNKQNLPTSLGHEAMRSHLNVWSSPDAVASANQGVGVLETYIQACQLALRNHFASSGAA